MKKTARNLAAMGRNGDTMLVHMHPKEVAGLQALAKAGGTSLSVNPRTGLPEAFSLKSLLPTIAGIIAAPFSGGSSLVPILAGAATGAVTGDKDMSLLGRMGLGALGGFGGAGIGNALGAAGTAAGNTATQLGSVGADLAKNAVGGVSEFVPTLTKVGGTAVDTLRASGLGSEAAKLMGQNMLTGAGNVLGSGAAGQAARGAFMNAMPMGKFGLAAAAAPMIGEAAMPPKFEVPEQKYKYYTTTYNPGEVNPNFGVPGESYFTGQKYGDLVEHDVKDDPFRIEPMAEGGEVSKSAQRNAVDTYIDRLNSKLTAPPMPRPAPAPAPVAPPPAAPPARMPGMYGPPLMGGNVTYNPATQTFSGAEDTNPYADLISRFGGGRGFFAGGGITSLGGYSDGGRLLKGPGDGVSDDIPATIHRDDGSKQEARLADGEFVVDARTVSELGNGSTEAGARKLYAMVDRVHNARRSAKLGKDSKAEKYLPA